MNNSKIHIIPILIVVGLVASYFNTEKITTKNRGPTPTEFVEKKLRRKEFRQDRKEYMKQMHRSHPDMDWQEMDRQIRKDKSEKVRQELESRLEKGVLNRSGINRVSTVNRNVTGEWNERGSNNLAGKY